MCYIQQLLFLSLFLSLSLFSVSSPFAVSLIYYFLLINYQYQISLNKYFILQWYFDVVIFILLTNKNCCSSVFIYLLCLNLRHKRTSSDSFSLSISNPFPSFFAGPLCVNDICVLIIIVFSLRRLIGIVFYHVRSTSIWCLCNVLTSISFNLLVREYWNVIKSN